MRIRVTIALLLFSTWAHAAPLCKPFRIHKKATLPAPAEIAIPDSFEKGWETKIVEEIGRISSQEEFPKVFAEWSEEHPRFMAEEDRYKWLSCLSYYVHMDTDGDGIPDWSSMTDRRPAQVLFPEDPDQDGDGLPNILDPDPLHPNPMPTSFAHIPFHLQIADERTGNLQRQLFEEFGVIAVNHTAEHSPVVLAELLEVLRRSLPKNFVRGLGEIRYVYAFSGHDPSMNVAAFHREAKAVSVGGLDSYGREELPLRKRADLIAALAHEIGHAMIFGRLSPENLFSTAKKFAGWASTDVADFASRLFSRVFFQPYPVGPMRNVVSQYAMTNQHEWFAESVAAHLSYTMGEQGSLGENWERLFVSNAEDSRNWINYANLSSDYRKYLDKLIQN